MTTAPHDSSETLHLLEEIARGDPAAFDRLFNRHRGELRRLVQLRLDPRIQARVDPSDVVQETHLDAFRRLDDYLDRRPMPFRIRLRKTAHERLAKLHRDHRTAKRSVEREQHLPENSSMLLVGGIVGKQPTPSEVAVNREYRKRVAEVVEQLAENDREILMMRNVEGLSHKEIALMLEIAPAAARKRYARALLQLQKKLVESGLSEPE